MKVLQVFKTFRNENFGGIENFIYSLSLELHEKGIHCDVVTTSDKATSQMDYGSSKVYSFKRNLNKFSCPISIDYLKQFKALTKEYDLIHYHHPWPFMDASHLVLKIKTPSVLTYHSDIVRQKLLKGAYYPIQRLFFNTMQRIITTSSNLQETSKSLRQYKSKTLSIPLSISSQLYPDVSERHLSQWQAKLPEKFFLFIGVLRYYKGLEFLLKAVHQQDFYLVIAGAGPEENRLRKLSEKLGIRNVIFLGFVTEEDKNALLQLCYSVICPSHLRSEAFGINLLEGLMFSKPLISTELGTGTSFVNQHMKTGIVVPPGKTDLLRIAMCKLYDDPVFYKKCVDGAKLHYHHIFHSQHMGALYKQLYESVLDNNN